MLLWIAIAVWLYLTLRVIRRLPIGPWRIALSLALLALLRHHWLTDLVWGSMFSLELPRPVVIAVNWLFAGAVLFAIFHALADVLALALSAFRRRMARVPAGVGVALAVAGFGVSGYAVSSAIRVPEVKEIEVEIADLPPAFEGYRFVHLTDLHVSRLFDARWVEDLVRRVDDLTPDMIVVSGDVIDGTPERRVADVAPLADLRAPDGIFFIAGNHEYYFGFERWMERLGAPGWRSVVNRHEVVARDGAQLVIAGVADTVADRFGLPGPDLGTALGGAPDAPVILLQHRPEGAAANAAAGVDLQLSGHTHGGMMIGFDRLVANANEGFVSGVYPIGAMTLYVSNGTALWPGFAYRLFVPPELTRVTLRAR
ncbi:metallophosphoesterase [Aureimonas phyllosphaerae]|uniref:metallophosphoesterase n=1 Tax=Aureimonas phyllosphaerae TaxID=1166078 RepID=UPI003A5BABC5